MRIAIVHSFYSSAVPSGENAVVEEQAEALAEAGHEVLLVARHTDTESRQPLYAIRSAARVMTGRGPDPTEDLREFGPDVVHVHNLFPNFGTRWLRSWSGPLVATLHNFRPICANGLLFRDGHYCDECPTIGAFAAVKHGCYHDSRIASIPLAVRNSRGPGRDAVLARADALVCLSEQAADVYRRLTGLDLPLHVIPNGIDVPTAEGPATPNGRWLVVSRLTPEKGVRELVEIWPDGEGLDIIGSGPEEGAIRAHAGTDIQLLGIRTRTEVLSAMPGYVGLVFPSRCLEMQPTVLTEAMSAGVPSVMFASAASSGTARAIDEGIGYVDASTLLAALSEVRARRSTLSHEAREVFERLGGRKQWVQRLLSLYSSVEVAA